MTANMVRKAPDARERFARAAMALFQQRGYLETTVPQIAAATGLTERTFFRYFADKPEVLFWRAADLEASIASAIARASEPISPLGRVVRALQEAGAFFDEYRQDVITRQAVVESHPDLQEREMMKMRSLASTIYGALQQLGVAPSTARVVAEAGVAIWRISIDRWCSDEKSRDFSHHVRSSLDELSAVFAAMPSMESTNELAKSSAGMPATTLVAP